jgi:hypothetical protein
MVKHMGLKMIVLQGKGGGYTKDLSDHAFI